MSLAVLTLCQGCTHAGQTPSSWKWFLKLAGGCGATAIGNDTDLTALRLCTFPQWTPADLPRGCISAEPREAARPVRTSQPLRDPSLLSVYLKMDKESACNVGDLGSIPGWEDPLEKVLATHSSILVWRIPGTEEPGSLYSP